jgi:rare lipoprotein A
MKLERMTPQSERNLMPASRRTDLLRATAVRVALLATVFGCTANAIAGDHDKPVAQPMNPTSATQVTARKLSAATRIKQWFETGQASWYGLKFQGKKTATGERFDMNTFTCAHRSLPLGSWLRVTNLRNRKSVLVRVNDRGPMVDSRIVDLSYAAARFVGLGGTGKVKLERVSPKDPEIAKGMLSQLSSVAFSQLVPAS